MTGRRVDVVVIGDGPAGCALAQSCHASGLDTLLVGADDEWSATYSTWVDDLPRSLVDAGHGDRDSHDNGDVFSFTTATIRAFTDRPHLLGRAYGVIDNDRLRARLRSGVDHLVARVERVEPGVATNHLVLTDGRTVGARLVIDAGGWPSSFAPECVRGARRSAPAWQTAFGVVLPEPPPGDRDDPDDPGDPGVAVVMDFRSPRTADSTLGPAGVTTFGYSLPVHDGWLVEETVLAARPAIEPVALVARLAARLGRHPDELLADAIRSEYVRIPMGGSIPSLDQPVVAFGAAAGYVHPATGYSLAASLRSAERVANAISVTAGEGRVDQVIASAPVWEAVWTPSMRRTRVLHEFGLEVLLRLDRDGTREFFGAFFDLADDRWATYLHIDTPPAEIASVMSELFRSSSWSQRRRLAAGNPAVLARLLRP